MSEQEHSRDRIMQAAVRLFAQHGLERTTLAQIARRAHLSKATLYHHFPEGKAAIFHAAVDGVVESIWNQIEDEVRRAGNPREMLTAYVHRRVEVFDRQMEQWGLSKRVWGTVKPWAEITLERYLERERVLLRDILTQGREQGDVTPTCDPETTARILQATMRGLTIDGPYRGPAEERRKEVAEVLRILREGVLLAS